MTRKIDDSDREAARNLKRLFEKAQADGRVKSQQQLADAMGINQPMFAAIIREDKACPEARIYRAAAFFRVSPKSIRSDLPDFAPAPQANDPIDEQLLEDVYISLMQAIREKGLNPEKIGSDRIGRMVAKLYKKTQETKQLDRELISYTIELLA
jgi:hypothetical protein